MKGEDGRVALELIGEDGRVLQRWSGELDVHLPRMEWKTLDPIPVPRERRVGLTFRVVEPPPRDARHRAGARISGQNEGTLALDQARFEWIPDDPECPR